MGCERVKINKEGIGVLLVEINRYILLSLGSDFRKMKFKQTAFTKELQVKIKEMEKESEEQVNKLLQNYKDIFANNHLELEAVIHIEGTDCFMPGYNSSIVISISNQNNQRGDVIDMHIIEIWSCERMILGMPVSRNIPGNKISGILLDESTVEIHEDINEFIEDYLDKDTLLQL